MRKENVSSWKQKATCLAAGSMEKLAKAYANASCPGKIYEPRIPESLRKK